MKKITQLFLLFAICISLTSFTNVNDLPATITITLHVNTADIESGSQATKYCTFNQPSGISNEEYTTEVRKGDILIWKGISSSSGADVVNITSIKHESGKELFGKKTLKGNGANPEMVIATVLAGDAGDIEKYKIKFTVYNNGEQRNGTYVIDPRVRIGNW